MHLSECMLNRFLLPPHFSLHLCFSVAHARAIAGRYACDLDEYWTVGGGHAIASEMAMMLLRDMFAAFDTACTVQPPQPTGSWRFAHAETTLPLLALLGIFASEAPLTASVRDARRSFRTSVVAPMAANIVASLHACDGSEGGGSEAWRVRFMLNERELVMPGCDGAVYCGLETLRAHHSGPLTTWNFSDVCGSTCECNRDDAACQR